MTNVAPTVLIVGAPVNSPEGTPITLTSTVSDPGVLDTHTYDWAVTKDSTPFASGTAAGFSFTPQLAGSYQVTLNVTDDDGGTATHSQTIEVVNVQFTVTIDGAPATSAEGSQIVLSSTVDDPSGAADHAFAWIVTKDGNQFALGSQSGLSFTPDDDGSYVITLTVTDDDGGIGTDNTALTVTNVLPNVTIGVPPGPHPEGRSISLTSSVTDPGAADVHAYAWTVFEGGATVASGVGSTLDFTPNDNGSYTVALDVTDGTGAGTHTVIVQVSNVSPTADAGGPYLVAEGGTVLLSGGATDPAGVADALTCVWDLDGDGVFGETGQAAQRGDENLQNPTFSAVGLDGFSGSSLTVTLCVTDDDGGTDTDTATIDIANVEPTVAIIGAPASSPEGTQISMSAQVEDPGVNDTHTFSWAVTKDGDSYQTSSDSTFGFTPDDNGSYVVSLCVTDDDSGTGNATSKTISVVNVAPSIVLTGDEAVDEGEDYTLTLGTITDPGSDTVTQWTVNWGDGLSNTYAGGGDRTHVYENDGTYTVTVDLADEDGTHTGAGSLGLTINPAEAVDFLLREHLSLVGGSLYYRVETSHDGILTLQVDVPKPSKSARLKLYDVNPAETEGLIPLTQSSLDEDGNQRIDWPTVAGTVYYVEVYGSNEDCDVRIANLIHHIGSTVTVFGTDGDDTFEFAPTGSYRVTINGVAYHFDETAVDTVQFDGGDGVDAASLNDSSGNDIYTVTPDHAVMESADFTVRAASCSVVHAYARYGGADTAVFIDSPGNDKVKAEDGNTVKMYSSNRSYYNRVKFFETVQVTFTEGGTKDNARLWDSPEQDTFDGMPGNSHYYSDNTAFDVTVLGADFITVYSTNGGNDKLILHDSPGDDVVRGKSHKVELLDRDTQGDVYKLTARKFEDVTVHADGGGQDIAKLYDSTLDDLWEAEYREGEAWSKMASSSRDLYEVLAFEQVKGYSVNGGTNRLKKTILPGEIDFVLTYGVWEDVP